MLRRLKQDSEIEYKCNDVARTEDTSESIETYSSCSEEETGSEDSDSECELELYVVIIVILYFVVNFKELKSSWYTSDIWGRNMMVTPLKVTHSQQWTKVEIFCSRFKPHTKI